MSVSSEMLENTSFYGPLIGRGSHDWNIHIFHKYFSLASIKAENLEVDMTHLDDYPSIIFLLYVDGILFVRKLPYCFFLLLGLSILLAHPGVVGKNLCGHLKLKAKRDSFGGSFYTCCYAAFEDFV